MPEHHTDMFLPQRVSSKAVTLSFPLTGFKRPKPVPACRCAQSKVYKNMISIVCVEELEWTTYKEV